MNIVLLYPSSPLYPHRVDELYQEEYNCAKKMGLSVHCFDIEQIEQSKITPAILDNQTVVYRGYMLNQEAYDQLEKRFGLRLFTCKADYFNAHHLPNWYETIKELTIPSVVSSEDRAKDDFKKFDGRAFIKDYVKSLKTGKGSIVDSSEDIDRAIADMKHYRGTIEGGIVLRDVVDFKENTEKRFFIVNHKIFSPNAVIDSERHVLVAQAVTLLRLKNLAFYTVDVAATREGKNLIIEIGDGQVSDYVGWAVADFVKVLSVLCSEKAV